MKSLMDRRLFEAPRGISAVGSASHWQCGGQGFKSPMLHQCNIIRTFCQLIMGSDLLF